MPANPKLSSEVHPGTKKFVLVVSAVTRFSAQGGTLFCLENPIFALLVTRLFMKKIAEQFACLLSRLEMSRQIVTQVKNQKREQFDIY